MRAQIKQFQQIEFANRAFKLEYDSIPGDLEEAEQYWTENSDVRNGNGDRKLNVLNSQLTHNNYSQEDTQYWLHLHLAGFMDSLNPTSEFRVKGVDFPESPLNNTGFYVWYSNGPPGPVPSAGHYMHLNLVAPEIPDAGIYSIRSATGRRWLSSHAKYLDEKIDDGNAKRGKLTSMRWWSPAFYGLTGYGWSYDSHCTDADGNYINLDHKGGDAFNDSQVNHAYPCMMLFKMDYLDR
jgi:hypothetical protein